MIMSIDFTELFHRPYFLTWIGAWGIFLGATVLLISDLFLGNSPLHAAWTSLWGIIIVCIGGILYATSTFINSSILISIGASILSVGLLLFSTTLAWMTNDIRLHVNIESNHTDEYIDHTHKRGIITTVSMGLVMIGIVFFVIKSIQRLVKPYLGPANYNLYGATIFGIGALCYMILKINDIKGVKVGQECVADYISYLIFLLFIILISTIIITRSKTPPILGDFVFLLVLGSFCWQSVGHIIAWIC